MSLWVTNIRSKQLPQPCKSTFLWFSHYILCHYLGDKSLFFAIVISFHCGRKEANGNEEEKRKHSFFRNTLTFNMISFQTFQEERILLHPKWQHRKKCNKKKLTDGLEGERQEKWEKLETVKMIMTTSKMAHRQKRIWALSSSEWREWAMQRRKEHNFWRTFHLTFSFRLGLGRGSGGDGGRANCDL